MFQMDCSRILPQFFSIKHSKNRVVYNLLTYIYCTHLLIVLKTHGKTMIHQLNYNLLTTSGNVLYRILSDEP